MRAGECWPSRNCFLHLVSGAIPFAKTATEYRHGRTRVLTLPIASCKVANQHMLLVMEFTKNRPGVIVSPGLITPTMNKLVGVFLMGPQQSSSPLLPFLLQSRLPLRRAASVRLCRNVRHVSSAAARSWRRQRRRPDFLRRTEAPWTLESHSGCCRGHDCDPLRDRDVWDQFWRRAASGRRRPAGSHSHRPD